MNLNPLLRIVAFACVLVVCASSALAQERVLRHEIVVDASAAEVWAAWTTKAGLESWLARSALIDLKPGGRFATNAQGAIGEAGTIELSVIAFEPERVLAYTTTAPADFPTVAAAKNTWAVLRLEPLDATTTRVHHAALGWGEGAEWEEAWFFFNSANRYVLEMLRRRFAGEHESIATGPGLGRVLSQSVEVNATPAQVWPMLTTRDGIARWLGGAVRGELRFGGSFVYGAESTGSDRRTEYVMAYEPDQMLATRLELSPELKRIIGLVERTWTVTRLEAVDGGRRTRVVRTTFGWGEGEEWDRTYRFFEGQGREQLRSMSRLLGEEQQPVTAPAAVRRDPATTTTARPEERVVAPSTEPTLTGRALFTRMRSFIGVWEAVTTGPEGESVRIRNVVERGPDGFSLIGRSAMGTGGLRLKDHQVSMVFLEPGTEEARFITIDELGDVARGTITLSGEVFTWDWRVRTAGGEEQHFVVRQVLLSAERYRMILVSPATGNEEPLLELEFERVRD